MKLVHHDFLCPIEFEENTISLLIMENPKHMRKFLESVYSQINGQDAEWVLSDADKMLRLDKHAEMVLNPFGIEVNQKKLLTALYTIIESEVQNSELLLEWNSLHPLFLDFAEKISNQVFFELDSAEEFSIKDFLKFMNVKFYEDESEMLEKLISYMRLLKEILGVKLIIFVNLKTYFSSDEIRYLYEQAFYWKIHILLVESAEAAERLEMEKVIIIDKDACIISQNMG